MASDLVSRRTMTCGLAVLPLAVPDAVAQARASDSDGLSRTSEAIHQEITFTADRGAVYEALTESGKFDAITRLSDAIALVTAPDAKPTSISCAEGGPFTLFGGYITGRQLEMLPNERLVQAWRVGSWDAGEYSLVRFALIAQGAGTKLVFDHRGFPRGKGEHLARGWHTHYWKPLKKFLSPANS